MEKDRPDVLASLEHGSKREREASLTSSSSTLHENVSSSGDRPQCFKSTVIECLFVLITTFAVAQNNIVTGSLRTQTKYVGQDLRMNEAEVTWIVAGQTMTSGTFLLFFARVADLFGRKQQLVAGMAAFSLLLLISGFARDPIFLNVFLGLSGVASAAVVPAAIGKLGVVYDEPSKRKNRAFSCFGAGAPVGVVIGSLIGGIASLVADWRASIWVVTVLYALLAVLAWFVVPPDTDQEIHKLNMTTLRKFDTIGALLCTTGLASFVSGLTEAAVAPMGWRTPYVLVLFLMGASLIVAFACWERVYATPLIPRQPWQDRNFTLLLIVLCLGFYGFNCNIFWLTLLWQQVYNDSPLEVAIKFLPASIGGIIMCAVAAVIIHRVSNRAISAVAACSIVASCALLSATGSDITYWALTFPALILSVVGQDLQFCVSNLYVVSHMSKEHRSIGGGLIQMMSRLAAAVGLGVQTSIYNAVGGSNEGEASMRYRPYQVVFWTSLGGATLALFFVPFLRLGTQGHQNSEQIETRKSDSES